MKPKIVFRADGSNTIGLGHIMRLLSLVEMLKSNFTCLFITTNAENKLIETIEKYCEVINIRVVNKVQEIKQLFTLLSKTDILVLDGYDFNEDYQQKVKALIGKLVMIDDTADQFYYADVIINHGNESIANKYRTLDKTEIYLGFKYLIARKEFLSAAKQSRKITKVDTVFICMGGADPFNHTIKILQACKELNFIKKINIVTGSAYKQAEYLKKCISEITKIQVVHVENIGSEQMIKLIKESEIAISSASTIALEICCVKSALICGISASNQINLYNQLISNNSIVPLGDWNNVSTQHIQEALTSYSEIAKVQQLCDNQAKYFDGKSAKRLSAIFKKLAA